MTCHAVSVNRVVYYTSITRDQETGGFEYPETYIPVDSSECCLTPDDWHENINACSEPAETTITTYTWTGDKCEETIEVITGRLVAVVGDEELVVDEGTTVTTINEVSRDRCCLDELEN